MTSNLDEHLVAYAGERHNPYGFDNAVILSWYPQRVLEQTKGARSVLELGLGHEITTPIFGAHFERHVVLDGSPAVIASFKTAPPESEATVVETYFETYETDERFDVIVMGFILEYLDGPVLVMDRYRRFLAPGGKMFVAVPNAEVLNRRIGHVAGLLPDIEVLLPNDHLLVHQRHYTVRTFSADIERAAYRVDTRGQLSKEGSRRRPSVRRPISTRSAASNSMTVPTSPARESRHTSSSRLWSNIVSSVPSSSRGSQLSRS